MSGSDQDLSGKRRSSMVATVAVSSSMSWSRSASPHPTTGSRPRVSEALPRKPRLTVTSATGFPFVAAGELSRSLPLRPAGDPEQQCAGPDPERPDYSAFVDAGAGALGQLRVPRERVWAIRKS